MFPGMGGMNPAQMQRMMKQLGIKTDNLETKRVTIELADGTRLVFDSAQVVAMVMSGQKTFTVMGEPREEKAIATDQFSEDDLQMVMEQTGAKKADAQKALAETHGDIAEAILKLKKS